MKKKKLIITIFGSTGDLTARKLLPAIKQLYDKNEINKDLQILALGRRDYSLDEYLDYMQSLTTETLDIHFFKTILTYVKMQITEASDYQNLKQVIEETQDKDAQKLFYLAIGPELLPIVAKNMYESNLVTQANDRIIFEKPFGHDLKSAKAINQMLWQYFKEEQIYRIDHYLGKEMIQNIMTVRFANIIFESVWNNQYIDSVQIIAKEEEGILNRAGYYDTAGALKDMVQSHLLQMLCLTAMDAPKDYSSEAIQEEKVKVLKALTFDPKVSFTGQYDGYLKEKGIKESSLTDTFVFLKAYVDNTRFQGVPFYLLTGKKLEEKTSKIILKFKPTKEQEKWQLPLSENELHIKIAPKDGVKLTFNSKKPGLKSHIEKVDLAYDMASKYVGNLPEAYEKLLLDAIMGHKTLFTRWDEIEYSWKFIDKVVNEKLDLIIYKTYEKLKKEVIKRANIKI